MILLWFIVWLLDNQPAVIWSPHLNNWAVFLIISIILL